MPSEYLKYALVDVNWGLTSEQAARAYKKSREMMCRLIVSWPPIIAAVFALSCGKASACEGVLF